MCSGAHDGEKNGDLIQVVHPVNAERTTQYEVSATTYGNELPRSGFCSNIRSVKTNKMINYRCRLK